MTGVQTLEDASFNIPAENRSISQEPQELQPVSDQMCLPRLQDHYPTTNIQYPTPPNLQQPVIPYTTAGNYTASGPLIPALAPSLSACSDAATTAGDVSTSSWTLPLT
ncbi:unnamed protein product [Sphagnum balticum]